MTRTQAKVLDFLRKYADENMGATPSYEELKTFLGLASKSGVHRIVGILVSEGCLEKRAGCSRSLRLVERKSEPKLPDTPAVLAVRIVTRWRAKVAENQGLGVQITYVQLKEIIERVLEG